MSVIKNWGVLLALILLASCWAGCALTRAGYSSAPYTVSETVSETGAETGEKHGSGKTWQPGQTGQPGHIEIRKYPALVLVQTSSDASLNGKDGSFMRLFRYISKGNASSQKIAMTTPVLMRESPLMRESRNPALPEGAGASMAFVLPAEMTREQAPAPADGAVRIETTEAGEYAALRTTGGRSLLARQRGLEEMRAILRNTKWSLVGEPIFASYDPPWIPVWFQRNEILWRVRRP